MEKQLWELWDMRSLQTFSHFPYGDLCCDLQSSRAHGEEKGFRYENPLFVKRMITMCKY